MKSRVRKGIIKASELSARSDLFLSHSNKDDRDLLNDARVILSSEGALVYIDVLDPEAKGLEPRSFGKFFDTAIRDAGRLVALVTKDTSTSLWIPWELGLAHGLHSRSQVAIWPVRHSQEEEDWAKQEYFELYCRIEWVNIFNGYQWGVRNPSTGKYSKLSTWIGKSAARKLAGRPTATKSSKSLRGID